MYAAEKESAFFTQADKCLDGECSLEDVDDLLMELKKTVKSLEAQVRFSEEGGHLVGGTRRSSSRRMITCPRVVTGTRSMIS